MKKTITIEEKVLLADHKEVVDVSQHIMQLVLDNYIEKLLKESIEEGQTGRLLVTRAKIDGMKEMMREHEQYVAKAIKS